MIISFFVILRRSFLQLLVHYRTFLFSLHQRCLQFIQLKQSEYITISSIKQSVYILYFFLPFSFILILIEVSRTIETYFLTINDQNSFISDLVESPQIQNSASHVTGLIKVIRQCLNFVLSLLRNKNQIHQEGPHHLF